MVDINDFVHDVSEEDVDRFESEHGKQEFWKAKEGRNQIRVLPGNADMKLGGVPSYQHFYKDPADPDRWVSHNCLRKMARQPCPSCERMEQLARSGNAADLKLANEMKPSYRGYYRIIDRAAESKGIQVWTPGWNMQQDINDFLRRFPNLLHPLEGFDILIRRRGTGLKTQYRLDVARDPSPIAADTNATLKVLEAGQEIDLHRYAAVPTYAQAVARITGGDDDGGGGGGGGGGGRALPSGSGGGSTDDDWDDGPTVADGLDGDPAHDDDVPF